MYHKEFSVVRMEIGPGLCALVVLALVAAGMQACDPGGPGESECKAICRDALDCPDLIETEGRDRDALLRDCIRDCEEFSTDLRACVREAVDECDRIALDMCIESVGDSRCNEFCAGVAACSANPEGAEENCLFDCQVDWSEKPGVVDCVVSKDPCSADWRECFDADPACAALCDRLLYECGMFTDYSRNGCIWECELSWEDDQRTCIEALECDGDLDSCFSEGGA